MEALLTILGSVLVAVITWFLLKKSEKDKLIGEDKRKLKKTLFYLLDIKHEMTVYKRAFEYKSIAIKYMKAKYEIFASLDDAMFDKMIDGVLEMTKTIKTTSDKENETIGDNFWRSVENLSEIDPLLAFRLSGKNKIGGVIKELMDVYKDSTNELINDPNVVNKALKLFEPKILDEALTALNEVIIEIAVQIDKKTLNEVKAEFEGDPASTEKEIYEYLDRIIPADLSVFTQG
jgi:hypothetical protein